MHVQVKDLSFSYTHKLVLDNLSIDIKSGSFLTLIGKNGSGKSTFIKCLLKIVTVPDNTIFLNGKDINEIKRFSNIGYVPQKLDFNYEFPITVNEILTSSYRKKKDSFYTSVINELDLNSIYRQNVNTLSGGQLQRVFIARSLLNDPQLLILDEPTVGIDKDSLKSLYDILSTLKKKGVTIIMSTHDAMFSEDLCDFHLEFSELGDYKLSEVDE